MVAPKQLLGPAWPARSGQRIGPSTRFWIRGRQMRLLRSQRRYLGFRRLRNRLFRLRRRRLRFFRLLRTRIPGPHVRYIVDGMPPNSVSSLQAITNGHNREKTAQEFAETSMCASCLGVASRDAGPRLTSGIRPQHTRGQRLRGRASTPPNNRRAPPPRAQAKLCDSLLRWVFIQCSLPKMLASKKSLVASSFNT